MSKKALISVSDKTGIVEFARELEDLGYDLLSTGGTLRILSQSGIKVQQVSDYTGFPEMMDGRVKTLHPKIHAGILALRDNEEHIEQMKNRNYDYIDIVVVNLYPFKETVKKPNISFEEAIENIDIGGPTMLRSAAKNFKSVTVVCDPKDYPKIISEMKNNNGHTIYETRNLLAKKVFEHTSDYDNCIYNYLCKASKEEECDEVLNLRFEKAYGLRYGENPHQKAVFYKEGEIKEDCAANAEVLHGKQLSFNNIIDVDAAIEIVKEFNEPACTIIKHTNPCGAATSDKILEALLP